MIKEYPLNRTKLFTVCVLSSAEKDSTILIVLKAVATIMRAIRGMDAITIAALFKGTAHNARINLLSHFSSKMEVIANTIEKKRTTINPTIEMDTSKSFIE